MVNARSLSIFIIVNERLLVNNAEQFSFNILQKNDVSFHNSQNKNATIQKIMAFLCD